MGLDSGFEFSPVLPAETRPSRKGTSRISPVEMKTAHGYPVHGSPATLLVGSVPRGGREELVVTPLPVASGNLSRSTSPRRRVRSGEPMDEERRVVQLSPLAIGTP
jgi:hypothetical protein